MEMAFSSLAQMNAEHRYLVLGDMGELGKFEKQLHFKTGAKAAQFSFDGLITVGPLCHELARGAKENGMEMFSALNPARMRQNALWIL